MITMARLERDMGLVFFDDHPPYKLHEEIGHVFTMADEVFI